MARDRRFPTRNYPYRRSSAEVAEARDIPAVPAGDLYRFVTGIDNLPIPMASAERARLNDPFAALLLRRGILPMTLDALLAALDAHNGDGAGVPRQRSFIVAEGGQIPWSAATSGLDRGLRFLVVRARGDAAFLMVSTATPFDSPDIFLQVIGWDEVAEVYHYYERRAGSWFWAGQSTHALEPSTRGQGPFDSHVNGSLVMKELKAPWLHWSSMAQTIPPESFPPDDPVRQHPLFTGREGAERLQTEVVEPGIDRWTRSRMAKAIDAAGRIHGVRSLMRHALTTTSVNIVSSVTPSAALKPGKQLGLPLEFFVDRDGLFGIAEIDADISPIAVDGAMYLSALARFEVELRDDDQGFRQPGDTFFAFAVPERAYEDQSVLRELVGRGALTRRLLGALLMVDFPNPIGSKARERLMRHVPDAATLAGETSIEAAMLAAMRAALDLDPGLSAERAVLDDMAMSDDAWARSAAQRIEAYFANLQVRAGSQAGVDEFLRLADSRRRAFRRRPLAEFDMTLAWTNIARDAPILRMRPDGVPEDDV